MNQQRALEIIQQNKTAYDLIGEEFTATRQRLWPEMELLVKRYIKAGDKVLDIGCGNGRLLKALPRVSYWGVDSSNVLLSRAKKLADELGFKQVNFEKLDMLELDKLSGNDFDVVFMLASFNHIPSRKLRLKILNDAKKLLKPAGLLLMTNWNMWQLGARKSVWKYKAKSQKPKAKSQKLGFKDVMTVWQNGVGNKKGKLYYRAFTRGELKKLFKQSGFKVLENYYSSDGKKSVWWRAKNIVTVGRLID